MWDDHGEKMGQRKNITIFLSFEPNNWLAMLMDQIYSKMSCRCQQHSVIYQEFMHCILGAYKS